MRQILITLVVLIVGAAAAFLVAHNMVTDAAPAAVTKPPATLPPEVKPEPAVVPAAQAVTKTDPPRPLPRRKPKPAAPTADEITDPRVTALVAIITDPHRSIADRIAWAENELSQREIGHVRDRLPQ